MASLNMTSADAVLKQLYRPEMLSRVCYEKNPLLGILPKFTGFGGRNMPIPLQYGRPMGRSATFSTAQSNAYASSFEDFLLTRIKDYGVATIDGETADAMEGDNYAFVKGMSNEIDGILKTVSRNLQIMLYRDSSGQRGTVGSESTVTLTLSEASDAVNFEIGMELVVAASTAGALRDSGNHATITGIDRAAGTLTSDSNWVSQISGLAANDVIFQHGDYVSASDKLMVSGLEAWVPSSAPGATAFFGVARNVDATRLGGTRFDGSALTVVEAINAGQSLCAQIGEGAPDYVFLNHLRYRDLIDELGAKVEYDVIKANGPKGPMADVLFEAVKFHGVEGPMHVVPDNACQHDVAWLLQLNTWQCCSLGPAPKLLSRDGLRVLRQSSDDGYEVRTGYYANLACKAPGRNCRATLPT